MPRPNLPNFRTVVHPMSMLRHGCIDTELDVHRRCSVISGIKNPDIDDEELVDRDRGRERLPFHDEGSVIAPEAGVDSTWLDAAHFGSTAPVGEKKERQQEDRVHLHGVAVLKKKPVHGVDASRRGWSGGRLLGE